MIGQTIGNKTTIRRANWPAVALGLLLALALVGGGALPASGSIPDMPMGFAGTVSTLTPAEPVPAGILVRAYVDNQFAAEVTTTAGGVYDNLLVRGKTNQLVTFTVAGVQAHQTIKWSSGVLKTDYDLTIDALPPMTFSGTVSTLTPAEPVPAGILVRAYVDNQLRAEVTTTAGGQYENLVVSGPGGTVTFRVAGVQAHESTTWVMGEVKSDYNLTIDALPPMTFSGTVSTLSPEEPVPAGILVQAYVDNQLRAGVKTTAGGQYQNLQVPGPGVTVTFRVAGVQAYQSTDWVMDEVKSDYDLTIDALPVSYYGLTMAVNPAGTGEAEDLTDASPYAEGVDVSIRAKAAVGYRFVNWTAPAGSFGDANARQTTFTMPDQDVTVTANFAEGYTLIMAVEPPGTGTAADLTGHSAYDVGDQVSIVAEAAEGYRFVNWTAPAGSFADANAGQTTFTMPAQDVTVTANFAEAYTLTMAVSPADTGTAQDLTADSPYHQGDQVSITAQPADGYRFVNWTAPAGSFGNASAANTTFTMPDQNVTATANFEEEPDTNEFTLTMAAEPLVGGTLNPPVGTHLIEEGQTVTIQVVAPASGYQFLYWMSSPGVTFSNANAPSTSFTMPGNDLTVTAIFAQATDPVEGGCFIATAAYGTPSAAEIDVLREFRDAVLLESALGSRFVDIYYRLSPPVADLISGSSFLRTVVRELLVDPAVWLVRATRGLW